MPSSDPPTFLFAGRSLPSDQELERLTRAIRRAAKQRDFSPRTKDRYQAWILVFISWCLRTAPYQVRRSRIGAFRSAMANHSDTGSDEVCEAMDALGFLFGAVDNVEDLLSRHGERSNGTVAVNGHTNEESSQTAPDAAAHHEDAISTIRLGWQAQEHLSPRTDRSPTADEIKNGNSLELSDDVARRLQRLSVQLGLPPRILAARAIDLVCDEVGGPHEQYSPTHLVEQYQTQIDLLHSVERAPSDDSEAEESTPDCWDAVDQIIEAGERSIRSAQAP